MSKIDDILSSSNASDALLGEQIDKVNSECSVISKRVAQIEMNYGVALGKTTTSFSVPITTDVIMLYIYRADKMAPALYYIDQNHVTPIVSSTAVNVTVTTATWTVNIENTQGYQMEFAYNIISS